MKSIISVDNQQYNVEVWMMQPVGDIYRFGLQVWGNGIIKPYSIRLSETFLEDEIDNDKNQDYLEQVTFTVAQNHLTDILSLSQVEVIHNLNSWYREAKHQLDKNKK